MLRLSEIYSHLILRRYFLKTAIDTSFQMFLPHDILFLEDQNFILFLSGKFSRVKSQISQGKGSYGRIYKVIKTSQVSSQSEAVASGQ